MLREIPPCPPSGGGVHSWLMQAAWACRANGMGLSKTKDLLYAGISRPPKPSAEIETAVRKVFSQQGFDTKSGNIGTQSRWPSVDNAARSQIIGNAGLSDLWELSPNPRVEADSQTEEIIDTLFPGDPLLCCGESNSRFATRPRSKWQGRLSSLQFIVPNPMSAISGKTKDGKESEHALSNTGPRRFLVIEQDTGTLDEQAAVLVHLAERAPLVLAVHSGSRSIHGWFYCLGQSEDRLRSFMNRAVCLGADRATWTRSQFVRMPDGTREGGARQTVFFFNRGILK